MWQNIGKTNSRQFQVLLGTSNRLVIHADCQHANRGLFAGLVVMVAVVVSVIVFFLAVTDHRYVTAVSLVAANVW